MKFKTLVLATSIFIAAGVVASQAQALSGKVSSAEEGLMEGVLVSAKREGSTVTTTVLSNDRGQFQFPAGTIEPGRYTITIRAAGYTLVGPKSVDVAVIHSRISSSPEPAIPQPSFPMRNGSSVSRVQTA